MNNKKKIYIAGSFENREKIKKWMIKLKDLGFEIPVDWTIHIDPEKYIQYAFEDYNGVKDCDIFILDTESKSSGKYMELAFAIEFHKQIFIVGKLTTVFRSFTILEEHKFDTFDKLIIHIKNKFC